MRVVTDRVAVRPDKPVLATRSAFADRGDLSGGGVTQCAGPWRTSGNWWTDGPHKAGASHEVTEENQKALRVSVSPSFDSCSGRPEQSRGAWPVAPKAWDRDEWDVTLSDGATYRVFRDRRTDAWFLEGIVD